jgi:NAD(P)-dependent dehydrogenase (short-subunit alcohol dehydrogenase family)
MNKAFFVTGVSGAIGKAVADELAGVGAVFGLDRVEPDEDTRKLLAGFISADLSELVENKQEFGRFRESANQIIKDGDYSVKGLINGAAIQQLGPLESISLKALRQSYSVNCLAPVALAQIFFDSLAESNGVVVNIGSIHATLTKAGFGAYAATKAALASLTRSMALDWGGVSEPFVLSPRR